jgi:uncharacterized protein
MENLNKLGEEFLSAYAKHNFGDLAKLMHDDVKWSLPGQGAISGLAIGLDAVISRVKAIIDSGVKTELHHILIGQFGITLSLRNTALKPDGLMLDEELATVITIESGRIKSIDTYLSDVPMMERFF